MRETVETVAGLEIVTGDSPYALVEHLDQILTAMPLPPFDDDIVVVQSLGMERWVRQQLARRRGCAASLRLPFPAAFCRSLADALQPLQTIDARFEEEALTWRLFSLLSDEALMREAVYAPLRQFLSRADPVKRYGLARRISGRFDEYRLYRPQWLLDWESGSDAALAESPEAHDNPHVTWQRALWQRLLEGKGERPLHFARWFLQTIERLEQATVAPGGLPPRLSVFGISTLPPLFIRLLQAVARFVPVRFHVLIPDGENWRPGEEHSPLFEQFGHASRELLGLLTTPSPGGTAPRMHHVRAARPSGDTLLHHLQRAMLGPEPASSTYLVAPNDRSIGVHICHSPLREMEVLRDQLLDAFASDPSLRPHDILVMVPDVERYAPLAESVFGGGGSGNRITIPFRVADRALARESAPLQAFELLLGLVTSRLSASEVMRLLALAPVRRRLGITVAQVEHITTWVQSAGIRWGWDAADRAERLELPAFGENSWRTGLDRLLAGYAAGPVDAIIDGRLPVAGDLAGDSELLGVFADWAERLDEYLRLLRTPRVLSEWSVVLEAVLTWAVEPNGAAERRTYEEILSEIRALQGTLRNAWPYVPLDDDGRGPVVAFEVVRDWLSSAMQSREHATGFLTGGLTICAMKPMRAIPHRVIAMLGLDDRAYPRRERRPAFDLIGSTRQPGDRDPRMDDRQLILDTLLCAEDRLHISYVGRSQTNNAEIAPSIVVAELLQYLQETVRTTEGAPHPSLRVEHRLQPFSVAYFATADDPTAALFSYDAALARSISDASERLVDPPFVGVGAHTVSERLVITLDDLMAAWCNPSRFHAERVLQLSLRAAREAVQDIEPMQMDGLLRTRVQQRMLEDVLHRAHSAEARRMLVEASGELPPGPLGEAWYDRLSRQMAPMVRRIGRPQFLEPLTVDVERRDWQLVGRLDFQLPDEQWRVRAATLKVKDLTQAWIAHVARAAAGGVGPTRVMSLDGVRTFEALQEPMALLDVLIGHYRRMLSMPVPYFPGAAEAYRKAVNATKKGARLPLDAARAAYVPGGEFSTGDADDPYVALLWRGRDPFETHAEEFVALTEAFWVPAESALTTEGLVDGQADMRMEAGSAES